jgi:hypothetical protein
MTTRHSKHQKPNAPSRAGQTPARKRGSLHSPMNDLHVSGSTYRRMQANPQVTARRIERVFGSFTIDELDQIGPLLHKGLANLTIEKFEQLLGLLHKAESRRRETS